MGARLSFHNIIIQVSRLDVQKQPELFQVADKKIQNAMTNSVIIARR